MCRIAGILNYKIPPTETLIKQVRDSMKHGGPDGCGVYLDAETPLALGHRRLSLLDLSPLGHQPMLDRCEQIVIVFNGEIYNFFEIKKELSAKGYTFRSTSDTEVIIYAYKEWGIACFERFNGMFALAIFDKLNRKIILARDHAGIKPLYYSLQEGSLYFASEIRAFKAIKSDWPENPHWKKYFLLFGHLPEPITTLENVQPVEKGSYIEIDLPTLNYHKHHFYKPEYKYIINNLKDAEEAVREKLTAAVERHLISDAPIGLFLSGGIDSSLLTIIAQPFLHNNLHTLSIVFDDEKFSEKYYQDIIIKQTGALHRSYLVTEKDFANSLPDITEAMDQPTIDGINSYFISKYAKAYGLKAVLSGIGADELFGGYPSFNRNNILSKSRLLPKFLFAAAKLFSDDKRKKINFLQMKNALGNYLFNRGFFIPAQVAQLLDCTEREILQLLNTIALPGITNNLLGQEQVSYTEINLYMQNQLLKDTDCMSMWHSVEVRIPFLDKDLLQLVYSINPIIRYDKNQKKHLLIKAFEDILPKEIWNRPKQGFTFPFDQWFKDIQPSNNYNPLEYKQLYQSLLNGKTHWSRYWCYLLAQEQKPVFKENIPAK